MNRFVGLYRVNHVTTDFTPEVRHSEISAQCPVLISIHPGNNSRYYIQSEMGLAEQITDGLNRYAIEI